MNKETLLSLSVTDAKSAEIFVHHLCAAGLDYHFDDDARGSLPQIADDAELVAHIQTQIDSAMALNDCDPFDFVCFDVQGMIPVAFGFDSWDDSQMVRGFDDPNTSRWNGWFQPWVSVHNAELILQTILDGAQDEQERKEMAEYILGNEQLGLTSFNRMNIGWGLCWLIEGE